jgi:hypothetical protein
MEGALKIASRRSDVEAWDDSAGQNAALPYLGAVIPTAHRSAYPAPPLTLAPIQPIVIRKWRT